MNTVPNEPSAQPGQPSPPQRSGCAIAFMVILGIILLLPGLCAVIFAGVALQQPGHIDPGVPGFIIVGLLIGILGILLIREAWRGPRS